MNIALLSHQFPGARAGGIGTYTLQAATALTHAGHSVHLFTLVLPPDVLTPLPPNLHLHTTPDLASRVLDNSLPAPLAAAIDAGGEAVYRLAIAWLLCEAARDFHRSETLAGRPGIDILEAPDYEALALPLLLHPEPDIPIITHLHLCSALGRAGNNVPTTPAAALIDALEFAAILLADARCAPTTNVVTQTRRLLALPDPIATFPHPMTLADSFTPPPASGPILFVGRLEPLKGAALMPPAFNRFLARNPDATIRLVGSDTQWPAGHSVRAQIESQLDPAIRTRVVFAGEKSPADVRREFAACRFSICPSLYESFAYVAAESLIAGRPVVVSTDIGATDVVGPAGISFTRNDPAALADAMETLHRSPALLHELAEKAFARAHSLLSPHNTIDARIAFYQSTAARLRTLPRPPIADRLIPLPASHLPPLLVALTTLTGTLAGASSAAPLTPGARLLRIMHAINPAGAEVLLYGAGRHTTRLLAQRHLWESHHHRVVGLIDDHPRFAQNPIHLNLPVTSSTALATRAQSGETIPPIILSTDTFQDQFWTQTAPLRALGIAVHRLYT